MKRQLNDLVMMQRLDALLAEATPTEVERLRAERDQLASGLSVELLRRYERLRLRYRCAVVTTQRGVCLGCFTVRPSAMTGPATGFETCERCGRILVRLEAAEESTPSSPAPRRPTPRTRPRSRSDS
jgi:predicted  nucleic acid-binding Zn-ribbon protein